MLCEFRHKWCNPTPGQDWPVTLLEPPRPKCRQLTASGKRQGLTPRESRKWDGSDSVGSQRVNKRVGVVGGWGI